MLSLTFAFPGCPSYAGDDTLVPLSHAPTLVSSLESGQQRCTAAGNKGPAMSDYNRDAGNKESAVGSLAAQMNCIPGINTAQLREVLLKLQIPAVEEVP